MYKINKMFSSLLDELLRLLINIRAPNKPGTKIISKGNKCEALPASKH